MNSELLNYAEAIQEQYKLADSPIDYTSRINALLDAVEAQLILSGN